MYLANTSNFTLSLSNRGEMVITVSELVDDQVVEASAVVPIQESYKIALNMMEWLRDLGLDWRFRH
jgi:hypothetical protein